MANKFEKSLRGGGYQPLDLGSFDFELAVEQSGPPGGSAFFNFCIIKFQTWSPKIGIFLNHDCGCSMVSSGSPEH